MLPVTRVSGVAHEALMRKERCPEKQPPTLPGGGHRLPGLGGGISGPVLKSPLCSLEA